MNISIISLETKIEHYLEKATLDENIEILEGMLDGLSLYNIAASMGRIDFSYIKRSFKIYLRREFSDEEIDELFFTYYRLIYFNVFIQINNKQGKHKNYSNFEDYLKSLPFELFINHFPEPTTILLPFFADKEFLGYIFNPDNMSKPIKEIEEKAGRTIEVRKNFAKWISDSNYKIKKSKTERFYFVDRKTKDRIHFKIS